MKKQTPFLDFHDKYVESGEFTENVGLCREFVNAKMKERHRNMLYIFSPSEKDIEKYKLNDWWGDEGDWDNHGKFTAFRQNVVLFLAAINGEL